MMTAISLNESHTLFFIYIKYKIGASCETSKCATVCKHFMHSNFCTKGLELMLNKSRDYYFVLGPG